MVCSIWNSSTCTTKFVQMIIFYSKVKFGPFYLCMGKHLRCRIPRNWWILWGESWYIQSNKWIHDNLWLLKVKVIHWPLSKVTQIQLFQSSFPQKPQGWLKQNFMESPWEVGNENLFHVTWPCPYMIKNFKNLFFPNQETGDLKTIYIVGFLTTINFFKWWPWVDLEHFYDRVRFIS